MLHRFDASKSLTSLEQDNATQRAIAQRFRAVTPMDIAIDTETV
jgi:hypothetical protein